MVKCLQRFDVLRIFSTRAESELPYHTKVNTGKLERRLRIRVPMTVDPHEPRDD